MAWKGSSPEYDVPDPAEVIRMVRTRYGSAWRKKGLSIGLAVFGLWAAISAYYQVEPDEVGVIRRLGRYARVTEPGPHFKIPLIEAVTKVPVQRQMKLEFGFRTAAAGTRTSYSFGKDEHLRESLMLTGDLNVAVVEWIVQYKIKDPYQYLFKVRNVNETLATLSEAAMRYVVGDHSVNEVLTTGRQKVADKAKVLLQQLADRYECGVDIQQVVLQDVNPPDPVKPSFNEVNEAIQEKERAINEAQAEMNKELPRARGEAEQLVRAAEGYAIERVNRARGEAERFVAVYQEYQKAPDITRRRMYLETMTKLMPRVGTKVVVDDAAKGLTPILQMDRAPMNVGRTAAVAGGDR
ncbi:MAG: FtsH protease activity modulator HflK [Myxococcales bacterium]|jgi:membrane protease subunit HflK